MEGGNFFIWISGRFEAEFHARVKELTRNGKACEGGLLYDDIYPMDGLKVELTYTASEKASTERNEMKILFAIAILVVIFKVIPGNDATSKPALAKQESTWSKVTPARHQCINKVRGSRKLGSGAMIGGTTNYTYTNKHPRFGEQRVVCGIDSSSYQLVSVTVSGVNIYTAR